VIVDGGSTDETLAIATQFAAASTHPLQISAFKAAQRGRSCQLNEGARAATGDILCFLHADTLVPDDLVTIAIATLANPTVACGGFISLMTGPQTTRWGISLHNYLKTYYAPLLFRPYLFFAKGLRLLFGDQVMFCRREDFWACDGFNPTLPIMEEADLCLRLVQLGRIRLVNRVVHSSDRRVAQLGSFKATLLYLYIGLLWGLGVSGQYLKQFYDDTR
jgi:glycosyltransferase involved in cell wall biosynthesis